MAGFEPIKLVVFVVRRNDGRYIEEICSREGLFCHVNLRGRGTVDNQTLKLLGLAERERDVVLITLAQSRQEEIMQKISDRLQLDKPGHGIAFSVPLSSLASQFDSYSAIAGLLGMKNNEVNE